MRLARGGFVLAALAGMAIGCPGNPSTTTAVIVGVTTDLNPGIDFQELDVDMLLNGKSIGQKKITATPSAFPLEIPFKNLAGGDAVEVDLKAMANGVPIVTRDQRTNAVAGKTLLFRVPIDRNCVVPTGPTCGAQQTCAAGQCINVFVDSRTLPAYSPTWAQMPSNDPCKPADQVPVVDVGEGQADYLPVNDGDVVQVEAGPQGGYHVWVALRMKGLRESSSITTVTGQIPDLAYTVAPFSVVFSFSPTDGGYCKIYGLRFRLDDPTHDIHTLLGHGLDLAVTVKDTDGSIGTGQKKVVLSTAIL